MQKCTLGNVRVNYINANANANERNEKKFMFLRLRLHFIRVNRGNAKVNANAKIQNKQLLEVPWVPGHHGAAKLKKRWRLPFRTRNWQIV